jgi:HEPN domain-containing protein
LQKAKFFMSEEKLNQEANRWYQQAIDDLEAAEALLHAKKYPQACFYAQQATEKALKAVWICLDLDPWGHSCGRLIRDLPESAKNEFSGLMDLALALDKLYIPTRYPDALVELTPAEAFTRAEAEAAIQSAKQILDQVNHWLSDHC